MEHRNTCQSRPRQGPAMKRRATKDSSATECSYINTYMIVNLQQYKARKQQEQITASFDSFFANWINLYIHYVFYPMVAATVTIQRKRITVL